MNIRDLRKQLGDTQSEFAARYNIPFRTVQNWETGLRKPPEYIISLLETRIQMDLANRRTVTLPMYDARKKDLPKRSNYIGPKSWLRAVSKCLGDYTVFALDEALMCQGSFGGRNDEYLIWVYGDSEKTDYNGVVVLGNRISSYCIKEKDGLRYTDFNRTLADSLANEAILDMQGITEAVSKYYYSNHESFSGLSIPPEFQERFETLAKEAIEYYDD